MSIANLPRAFKIRSAIELVLGGHVVVAGTAMYVGNESFYDRVLMPCLRLLPPETAHRLAIVAAKYRLVPPDREPDDPVLKTSMFGMNLTSPVGLAAGFDKHGEGVDGLFKMGFSSVEVGSVTPKPQPGNDKPRLFRLTKDKAVINRYGFNSDGHDTVYNRLVERLKTKKGTPIPDDRNLLNENLPSPDRPQFMPVKKPICGAVGVNLGKNKDSSADAGDFVLGVKRFSAISDYLVVNVSSPNTPGLRDMQRRQILQDTIDQVVKCKQELKPEEQKPLFIKIAPDLTEKERIDIAAVVGRPNSGVDGLIVSNTTISRPASLQSDERLTTQVGGLSGEPLKELATRTIADMYRLTHGSIPIIGVGGISSGRDAYDKIRAGAAMVQIYTALTYKGPPVVCKVKRELAAILKEEGYASVAEAVGADFKQSES